MRADGHSVADPEGGGAGAAIAEPAAPGRIDVDDRVLVRVAQQASADTIGVPRAAVSADVAYSRSGLLVRLSAPLPIPDLRDAEAIGAQPPILERAATLQESLQGRLRHLLGREIVRIDLTITGAVIPERRRVR